MTDPDEPWVVTLTITYNDQDRWEGERGNIEWIDFVIPGGVIVPFSVPVRLVSLRP
jgi:hypothetical protein